MNTNIVVIYPPGAGGNHLANMLSTADGFQARCAVEDYQKHMTDHAEILPSTTAISVENISNFDETKNNVLCSPLMLQYWLHIHGLRENFKNRKIIIITVPNDKKSLAYKRYRFWKKDNNSLSEYYYQEQCSLYTQEMVEKILGDNDIFVLNSEHFFTDNLSCVYRLADDLVLSYKKVVFEKMHKLWLSNIKSSLNEL